MRVGMQNWDPELISDHIGMQQKFMEVHRDSKLTTGMCVHASRSVASVNCTVVTAKPQDDMYTVDT